MDRGFGTGGSEAQPCAHFWGIQRIWRIRLIQRRIPGCKYWYDPEVCRFLKKHKVYSSHLDGCMYGLKSSSGTPMYKPWLIKTTNMRLAQELARICDGSHEHKPCCGKDAKNSENYTMPLVVQIHRSFKNIIDNQNKAITETEHKRAYVCVRADDDFNDNDDEESIFTINSVHKYVSQKRTTRSEES